VTRDVSFTVPKKTGGIGTDDPPSTPTFRLLSVAALSPIWPAVPPAISSWGACLRNQRLQMVQAKVIHAATDSTVTLTWDRKTRLEPKGVISAFEFLDKQVADGEWSLRFDQLHFVTGKAFLKWQVDTSMRIELSQVTQ